MLCRAVLDQHCAAEIIVGAVRSDLAFCPVVRVSRCHQRLRLCSKWRLTGCQTSCSSLFHVVELGNKASGAMLLAALQVPVLPRDEGSFHCSLPRLMPLTAIDPSLAIGFFCGNTGECCGTRLAAS